jgi:hypothetical protein
LETNCNNRKPRGKINCHISGIAPSREEEAEGLNLRTTKHDNLADPNHPGRKIATREARTQEISSHRHRSTDLAMSGTKETMRTKKQRWGHHALPTGFAKHKYPRNLSYHMISKNMMEHRNPSHGCQIIFKLSKYSGAPEQ